MAYPPDHPPTLPIAIEYPIVPNTPAGAEELEAWRRQQLVRVGHVWLIPVLSFGVAVVFDLLGLPLLTALSALVAVCTGATAPGLTTVYLLRRRKARQLAESMPRLPRASSRLAAGRTERAPESAPKSAPAGGGRGEPRRP